MIRYRDEAPTLDEILASSAHYEAQRSGSLSGSPYRYSEPPVLRPAAERAQLSTAHLWVHLCYQGLPADLSADLQARLAPTGLGLAEALKQAARDPAQRAVWIETLNILWMIEKQHFRSDTNTAPWPASALHPEQALSSTRALLALCCQQLQTPHDIFELCKLWKLKPCIRPPLDAVTPRGQAPAQYLAYLLLKHAGYDQTPSAEERAQLLTLLPGQSNEMFAYWATHLKPEEWGPQLGLWFTTLLYSQEPNRYWHLSSFPYHRSPQLVSELAELWLKADQGIEAVRQQLANPEAFELALTMFSEQPPPAALWQLIDAHIAAADPVYIAVLMRARSRNLTRQILKRWQQPQETHSLRQGIAEMAQEKDPVRLRLWLHLERENYAEPRLCLALLDTQPSPKGWEALHNWLSRINTSYAWRNLNRACEAQNIRAITIFNRACTQPSLDTHEIRGRILMSALAIAQGDAQAMCSSLQKWLTHPDAPGSQEIATGLNKLFREMSCPNEVYRPTAACYCTYYPQLKKSIY
jgi:hypothetical protein